MNILGFLGDIFKPAAELVDNLHTSVEEKMALKNEIIKTQNTFAGKILDYETKLMDAKANIIMAEATGQSWLQRNWRPVTMLTFLILVALDAFGLLPFRLAAEAWALLKIGLGGYVIGRSVEKAVPYLSKNK